MAPADRLLAGVRPPFGLTGVRVWSGPGCGLTGRAIGFGTAGRVAAIGSEAEVRAALPAAAPLIDPGPCWVVPGFVDAHVHIRAVAAATVAHDISAAPDIAAVLGTVKRAAAAAPPGAWVSVWGLQPEDLREARSPTRTELDAVSGGHPVRIRHRSAHAWVLNTAALDRVGLLTASALPAGVAAERGPDGSLTGTLADHSGWLGQVLGRVTPADRINAAVRDWSRALARQGVVALVDATARNGQEQLDTLARWRTDQTIVQHVAVLTAQEVKSAPPPLTFVGHKLMPPFRGRDLGDALDVSWRQGITAAVHCADTETLGAIIDAAERMPRHARGGLRIEHASLCPPEWIARIAALGATVVTHPAFVTAHGDRYLRDPSLAPHEWLYRLASWLRGGVRLAVASDAPAGPAEPGIAWSAAQLRRTARGNVMGHGEALTDEQTLAAMTAAAAECSELGSLGYGHLRTGGPGAAVLLAGDVLCGAVSDLDVRHVIMEGRVVA